MPGLPAACRRRERVRSPLISEWALRRDLDGFLSSRDFLIIQGMRILLREEPRAVLDEVVVRKQVAFKKPSE